jgi:hypothetical protein
MWILLMAQDYQIDQANRWRCFYLSLPSEIVDGLDMDSVVPFMGRKATYLGPRFGNLFVKKKNLQRMLKLVESHHVIGYDMMGVPLDKQPNIMQFISFVESKTLDELIATDNRQEQA